MNTVVRSPLVAQWWQQVTEFAAEGSGEFVALQPALGGRGGVGRGLAGQIMKSGSSSLVTDLIVGVIEAILGGFLFGVLGLSANGLVGSLVTATLGACVLIAGLRFLKK